MPTCTAVLAEENIMNVECIDFPDLGMEAVWTIGVENFPAFVLVDDKGNDFFNELGLKFAGSVRASVVSLRDACA